MNILLTGHRGLIGRAIEPLLRAQGHAVRGFDLADGGDILDAAAVYRAARGMDAIVHCAGLPDAHPVAHEKMAAILHGIANVLCAAEAERVRRVVHMSSGKSLGMLERDPDYLPMDDDHRGRAAKPYGLAKWLSEEMCAAFTERTGVETVCLRPVAVFDEARYQQALAAPDQLAPPDAAWHMGVHVEVRDVAEAAVLAATRTPLPKHVRLLLCAADIAGSTPTLEQVAQHLPHVPWRGGAAYETEPYRALVDTGRAQRVLGWRPRRLWPGRGLPTTSSGTGRGTRPASP